ncbi:alpha/beta hydrolase [Saccharicrinis sp. 156]|uniref:alpha/beta hydrolase n=1 Tax=Saccharicrinis sp. 156 TaxID=3417574 RepID=UPI003D33EA10
MRYLLFILIWWNMSCTTKGEGDDVEPVIIKFDTYQYKNIDGVSKNLLSLDVYYTSDISNKKPIVVYVHGGGWSIGDKASQLDNKIDLFRSLNYVFVSINYRLSPFPFEIDNTSRIKYPDHNIDVADALLWIYTHIGSLGGDKNKIALLGHSAGAHLVALTGTNPMFLNDVGLSLFDIKGVACIDTESYDVDEQVKNGTNQEMYINAFGFGETINKEASPLFNIANGNTYPGFFIAKRGAAGRIAYADEFIDTLKSKGVSVSEVDGSIYDHAGINNAIGDYGETLVTDPLIQFFAKCFE